MAKAISFRFLPSKIHVIGAGGRMLNLIQILPGLLFCNDAVARGPHYSGSPTWIEVVFYSLLFFGMTIFLPLEVLKEMKSGKEKWGIYNLIVIVFLLGIGLGALYLLLRGFFK